MYAVPKESVSKTSRVLLSIDNLQVHLLFEFYYPLDAWMTWLDELRLIVRKLLLVNTNWQKILAINRTYAFTLSPGRRYQNLRLQVLALKRCVREYFYAIKELRLYIPPWRSCPSVSLPLAVTVVLLVRVSVYTVDPDSESDGAAAWGVGIFETLAIAPAVKGWLGYTGRMNNEINLLLLPTKSVIRTWNLEARERCRSHLLERFL